MISCGSIVLPDRLRHLAALLVHDEAVREVRAVRRLAPRADADEQRTLEPAAVLIAALEVEVGRPPQAWARQHRLVARAGVEPDVQDVALADEFPPAALRARQPGGQELLDRALVPGVRAVLGEHLRRLLHQCRGERRPRRTSRSPPPGSAHPTSAGARCTSPAGAPASSGGAPRPTPGSTAPCEPPRARARADGRRPSR